MLPLETEFRLLNPGAIETAFINYLKKSKAKIDQDKTIASVHLYHQKEITGLNTVEFFTGDFIAQNTNIEGSSFIRPMSEHFVITQLKIFIGETPESEPAFEVNYTPGIIDNLAVSGIAQLTKATLNMEVNGIRYLKNLPLGESDANLTGDEVGQIPLNEPILWQGNTDCIIQVKAKPGQTFGNVGLNQYQYMRMELIGIGLI